MFKITLASLSVYKRIIILWKFLRYFLPLNFTTFNTSKRASGDKVAHVSWDVIKVSILEMRKHIGDGTLGRYHTYCSQQVHVTPL